MLKKSNSLQHSATLSLFAAIFFTSLPVYAVNYIFPSNPPADCNVTQAATPSDRYTHYTCEALPLAAGDTLAIGSPSKVWLNGALVGGADVKINENGSAEDLYIHSVGAIGLTPGAVLNAHVTSDAAIDIGANSHGSGSLTTNIGAINVGANVIYLGNMKTGTGGLDVGAGSTVGSLTLGPGAGAATIGASTHVKGNIRTSVGAVLIGATSVIDGDITLGSGAGAATIGASTHIGGNVSTAVGAITVGADSDMCGNVSAGPGVGAVTLGANVHVGGNISAASGAITIGADGRIGGSVTTPDARTIPPTTEINSKNVTRCVATAQTNICENGVNKKIDSSAFQNKPETSTYYLGKCAAVACTNLEKTLPANCTPTNPVAPTLLLDEVFATPTTCPDGDLSNNSINNATVKRANVINATTENGNITFNVNTSVKYGEKGSGGTMDLSTAVIDRGHATGVRLTGVTLNNVHIDSTNVTGGKTTSGTITSGMITEGTDSVKSSAVRGSIQSGDYVNYPTINSTDITTQGRRTRGTLTNATIANASTTTVNGVTVVDGGTIISGTITNASTFGTVTNATLADATISNANSCFTSGTVGLHGQLNWKEGIKR